MSAASSTTWSRPRSLLWLVMVAAIALGIGGLVGTLDHPPGDATRPELTARKDRAAAEAIASLASALAPLADDVAKLREIGRAVLAHVSTADPQALGVDVTAGNGVLDRLVTATQGLGDAVEALPAGAERSGLSQLNQAKVARVEAAVTSVTALDEAWRRVAGRVVPRVTLTVVLAAHRDAVAAAAAEAAAGRFGDAVETLGAATALLDQAERLRAELAVANADVTALGEWLLRARTRDEAYRALDQLLITPGSAPADVATAQERAADAERAMPLPDDQMIAVVGEQAGADVDETLIAMESADGAVADALRLLAGPPA